jgi:enterochelin esterase-like enzyme
VPQIRAQTVTDFNMLISGTAVPGVIPTPPERVLPPYIEKRTFRSAALDRDMPYYIYLPPGYDTDPAARWPVLYMLHGMQGTYNEWLDYGLLGRAHDLMSAGQSAPFIIVVPQGDQSYWVDHDDGPPWGRYVAQDLVAEVDAHYRTLADRDHRAVGGLSMGGYGALTLAITYPEVFSIAGAHSPSLHGQADAPSFLSDPATYAQHDPVALYQAHAATARTLQIYLDVGQDDPWRPAIAAFHQLLQAQNIPHEWHAFPGDHGGVYWSTHVIDYLLFYSRALTSPAPTPGPATATPAAAPSPSPTVTPTPAPGPRWRHGGSLLY